MKRGRNYSYTVFIRNISHKVTEKQIKQLMAQAGPIKSFRLFKDARRNDRHHGRAKCEYYDREIMESAIRNLDGYSIGGRTIFVGVDPSAVLPDVNVEEEPEEKRYRLVYKAPALTEDETKRGYQLLMAAKMMHEDDPEKFKKLCRENQQTTFELVQMSLLMGMNPGLIETAKELLAAQKK
jgi:RNA recognition motif-containing protein